MWRKNLCAFWIFSAPIPCRAPMERKKPAPCLRSMTYSSDGVVKPWQTSLKKVWLYRHGPYHHAGVRCRKTDDFCSERHSGFGTGTERLYRVHRQCLHTEVYRRYTERRPDISGQNHLFEQVSKSPDSTENHRIRAFLCLCIRCACAATGEPCAGNPDQSVPVQKLRQSYRRSQRCQKFRRSDG